MSVTVELLDAFKAAMGGISDYRVGKIIGVSQPTVSGWRNNACPISPEKMLIACEMAGLDAVEWLLSLYRERAKCDKEKTLLDTIRGRMVA